MADVARTTGAPTPFGKYLLDEEIATGGMARVYRARLRGVAGFEKKLVVKQVLPELAKDPRFVELFVREAKMVVEMAHPNVVPVYELGVIDDVYFLAMEYVEGATLAEILEHGRLEPALVAHVGVMVSEALQYAHGRLGLVHRDVTPRNVIVDRSGHVRLLDFGIAAPATAVHNAEVFGSHGYMSPEQARGEGADARSDLFSLGCVLFECLCGRPAYQRKNAAETREALLSGAAPELDSDLPIVVAQVVRFLLGQAPSDRPNTAAEVAKALRHWLASSRPEGVATELAARVDQSRSEPKRPHSVRSLPGESLRPPSSSSQPPVASRSIATSAFLQSVLTEHPAPSPVSRTVRIEGRARRTQNTAKLLVLALTVAVLAGLVATQIETGPTTTPPRPPSPLINREPATGKTAPSKHPAPLSVIEPPPVVPQPPEERPAQISANARPWAKVAIDGRAIGNTPIRALQLAAGMHSIAFDCPPLGRHVSGSFRVGAGESVRVFGNLEADPPVITTH